MHIARADLENVCVLSHQFHVAIAHHLRDDAEAGGLFRFGQQLQPFRLEPLEIVRRSARLESPSTQKFCSGLGDAFSRLHNLLLGFHRAGTRHDDELIAPDLAPVHANLRTPGAKLLAYEFVRGGNPNRFLHLRHSLDGFQAGRHVAHTHYAYDHPFLTFNRVDPVTELLYTLPHLIDLLPGRMSFHRYDHFENSPKKQKTHSFEWAFLSVCVMPGPLAEIQVLNQNQNRNE